MKGSQSIIQVAEIVKVLGHPMRIEILRLLSASGRAGLTVKEVHEKLRISQPEASKHLIAMKNRAIVFCERKEGHAFYWVNSEYAFLRAIISFLQSNEKDRKKYLG
jgi:DNA-binding transcriptional ArsR family regulator